MEELILSILILVLVFVMIKKTFPMVYGVTKKFIFTGIKGWMRFLYRPSKKGGGAKVQHPRMRYRA